MRKEPLITGEYYHIYNRGVDKRDIFNDLHDSERFKESIKEFNQVDIVGSLQRQHKVVRALDPNYCKKPLVAIVCFCVNPNHFHFVLKQLVDGGIAKFMQKLLGGYTSFFNQKHQRSGSLFQGTFKSKLLSDEGYFRKIFAYVNQNYLVHSIPAEKLKFIFASDAEYSKGNFDFIDAQEGKEMLEVFDGEAGFKNHCKEIISLIREERGAPSLNEPDELPC